ncbi:hypothetical protein J4E81_002906 [Alternaria sp. BMP 2799]|nr:hypothetical protein J4E81_002906 [Alternaria sp. BMP 2799]
MAFRFLDLSSELRNMVYHFASITDAYFSIRHDPSLQSSNYAALTRVCVQIRREYRPIQRRKAKVWIGLADVDNYARTFLRTAEDSMSLPHKIRVKVPFTSSSDFGSDFSIISVLKLKAAHPDLDCKLVHATIRNDSALAQKHMFFRAMNKARDLNALVFHANKKWLEDISNGTIGDVLIETSTCFVQNGSICICFTGVHALENYREATSAPNAWRSARGLDLPLSNGHHVARLFLAPDSTSARLKHQSTQGYKRIA